MKPILYKGLLILLLVLVLKPGVFSQAPGISYSPVTSALPVGQRVTLSPANTGGAVPATVYGTITTFAGSTSATSGYTNATGTAARFTTPQRIVGDGSGNLYVADYGNNAIRKITSSGVVTTFAGSLTGASGNTDGTGTAALFNGPDGLAIDASGNLFVSDHVNNLIRKITPAAVVTTFYTGGSTFGPAGLCFDGSGNLIVAAQGLSQIIRITPAGAASTIAGNFFGYANGTGTAALFKNPTGVQVDASGNIYVADYLNNAIRKITPSAVVSTFAGSSVSGNTGGFADGVGTAAKFNNPTGLAMTSGGVIYVADFINYNIRRILPDATVTLVVGSPTQAVGTMDGVGTAALLSHPVDLYIDPSGTGWDVDMYASVRKVVLTGYTISGGTLPAGLSFDPTTGTISGTPVAATSSQTYTVTGYNASGYSSTTITLSATAISAPSIRYISSTNNITVGKSFAVAPTNTGGTVPAAVYGQVTTFAGSASGASGYANATGTAALFHTPYAAVMDAFGNLYVADKANNAIRKITSAGVVTTFAGSTSGTAGNTNGTGTAATFNAPDGVTIDASGNLFVSDFNNNSVRKITPVGAVTTFASSVTGPAGLSFDGSGNLVVASQGGNKILKITSASIVSTIAGNTSGYVNGTGTAALFKSPADVQADASGNSYVADYLNNAIRKITPSAVVTTFAGNTVNGNTGAFADGIGTAARFNNPAGITSGPAGVLYVADYLNNDIRRVMPDATVNLIAGSVAQAPGTADGNGTTARFNNPAGLYIDGTGNGYVIDVNNNNIRRLMLTGYTISGGALPAGLSFDPTTGTISGTPTTVTASQTFVVTAYNRGGVSVTSLDISVSPASALSFDWTGAVSSDWSTGGNWSSGAVPGAADHARIGVVTFNHQPVVSTSVQVGTILFGAIKPDTLTVNTGNTLTVNGILMQSHSADNALSSTTLAGNGSLVCAAMAIGNSVLPKVAVSKNTVFTSKIASLSVTDSLVITSGTIDLLSGGVANNNAVFSLEGGVLSVGGRIKLDNFIPPYLDTIPGIKPLAKFIINTTSNQDATLAIAGSSVFTLTHPGLDSIDFYHYVSGTGKSTVIYSGGNQLVYTNNAPGLDTTPYTYQNLSVAGIGNKTAGKDSISNQLNIGGNLTITGGNLDLQTYSPQTIVAGNFNNTGAIHFGTSYTTFNGTSFFNAGSFVVSSGVIQFSGGAQTLSDSTAGGTNFRRVTFNHPGIKNIHSGKFAIVSNGKIRLSDTAALNVTAGATLTLRADSTGAAAIAALIAGCTVSGQLHVEQYIQGSLYLHNTSARGFKLQSSSVYTGMDSLSSAKVFDFQYLTHSLTGSLTDIILISGLNGTTNGFNVNTPTNTPSLYLFREDDPPPPANSTNFTTQYNFKGIAKVNNTPVYNLATQKFLTRTNAADTTTTIPVGNGFFTSFRGNAVLNNGTTSGDKITAPFNYPEDVTLTQVGILNTGEIKVRLWFANSANNLGYNFSFTPANLINTNATLRGARVCVGNPYPAPINWDNLSTTDSTSMIYGPNLKSSIYIWNLATGHYDTYLADPSHDHRLVYHGTGAATNIIASTQAFFAVVDSASATPHAARLTFREQAKFDPDAGSSPGSFSALAGGHFLKTWVKAGTQAGESGKLGSKSGNVAQAHTSLPAIQDREIRLRLIPVKDTVHDDDILINFRAGIDSRYDPKKDAYDLGGTEVATTMLSSYSSDHVKLAINSQPLPAKAISIGLYTDAVETGDFVLDASAIKNIPGDYRVSLKDKMTGRFTDLLKNNSYAFRIEKANKLSYGDRFELLIEKTLNKQKEK
jgi:sugar lactone lactonase YvrE